MKTARTGKNRQFLKSISICLLVSGQLCQADDELLHQLCHLQHSGDRINGHQLTRLLQADETITLQSLGLSTRVNLDTLSESELAFEWCARSAQAGFSDAQYQLGLMYLHGIGAAEDETRAIEWIYEAAVRGHSEAERLLEYLLMNDTGYGC